MVKTKHKKSKPPPPRAKKHGKKNDVVEMQAQLDDLGLKLIEVTADGNCFFRALADQLEGKEEEHVKYRAMVVQFIMNNRAMFEPFIEDEEPFDDYCQSMQSDGTWAGHMELQAASLVTQCNICIHQHMSPRWYILNFDKHEARMIHLSYHGGEHYNSVRSKDDACTGPARLILIKADADISSTSHEGKIASSNSTSNSNSKASRKNIIQQESIKVVISGSGCEDVDIIKKVLEQVGGDVDAAIEYLIAERGSNEGFDGNMIIRSRSDTTNATRKDEEKSQEKKRSLQEENKKISRNKSCPCGSKKKYKSCCGSIVGKSAAKLKIRSGSINEKKISNKIQSDDDSLNMGALCI